MSTQGAAPSLKDANAKTLFALLALNFAGFYLTAHTGAIGLGDWIKLATGWISALPAGAGVAATALLNTLVSSDAKANEAPPQTDEACLQGRGRALELRFGLG